MYVSSGNKIESKGAIALSQCLIHLTHLTQLYLRSACVHIDVLFGVICAVSHEIDGAMCDVWCVVCGVWCVVCDVSTDNNIRAEGAKALSRSLTHLTQLTHFDLSGECTHIDVLLGVICVVSHEIDGVMYV